MDSGSEVGCCVGSHSGCAVGRGSVNKEDHGLGLGKRGLRDGISCFHSVEINLTFYHSYDAATHVLTFSAQHAPATSLADHKLQSSAKPDIMTALRPPGMIHFGYRIFTWRLNYMDCWIRGRPLRWQISSSTWRENESVTVLMQATSLVGRVSFSIDHAY